MKKITFIILALLSSISMIAQTPIAFKYQAVAKDNMGLVLAEENISVQISILAESTTGTEVYKETHNVTTSTHGLFNLNVGSGSVVMGDMANVEWDDTTHFLKVEIDLDGGNSYEFVGVSQLLSVPYAVQAKYVEEIPELEALQATIEDLENVIYSSGIYQLEDIDGNTYEVGKFGDQVWMTENLRVTHYADGTEIPHLEGNANWSSLASDDVSRAYCWYSDDSTNYASYGALYTYAAAINGNNTGDNVQGVCPDGWHLPSDEEWKELEMFFGMSQVDADDEDWNRGEMEHIGSKMAGEISMWNDDLLIQSPEFGSSGFNSRPTGYRYNGNFWYFGNTAQYWTSSMYNSLESWRRVSTADRTGVARVTSTKSTASSVRCIKN
jgi:uncharacterized protein (TIGR02145 family)